MKVQFVMTPFGKKVIGTLSLCRIRTLNPKLKYKNKSAAFTSVVIKQALMCKESVDTTICIGLSDRTHGFILVLIIFV